MKRTRKRKKLPSASRHSERSPLWYALLLLPCIWMGNGCRLPARDRLTLQNNARAVLLARQKIAAAGHLLHDGDLVLRTGNDFISQTLRQFSPQDKTYSHCGIVLIENGEPYVYHAIGGEDNPDEYLRRERFASFCDPAYNTGFGIYRYCLSPAAHERLDSVVLKWYSEKIQFDLKFDLQTDNRMYCSEFACKALDKASGTPGFIPVSHIGTFAYVAIDNLFLNPHADKVLRVRFFN